MIIIKIKTDNSAFEDNPCEVSDILRNIAKNLTPMVMNTQKLRDSNGNVCGLFEVVDKIEPVTATIIVEDGCLVGVWGIDQYKLIDVDNLREQEGYSRDEVDAHIAIAGNEAIEE